MRVLSMLQGGCNVGGNQLHNAGNTLARSRARLNRKSRPLVEWGANDMCGI